MALTGGQLKAWREARDISRELLAVELKKTYSTIARWEQGQDDPIPDGHLIEAFLATLKEKYPEPEPEPEPVPEVAKPETKKSSKKSR